MSVHVKSIIGFIVLCSLVVVVYIPGINSHFILDDFVNLNDLELFGETGYAPYVFGGHSGPTGRPLALLSFAVQHEHWPTNPFAFKLINLLIHLINGGLIYLLTLYLLRSLDLPTRTRSFLLFFITGLWLLHPMQVSTVLYSVQRMTLLATMFMLTGLLVYLVSRFTYHAGEKRKGLTGMALTVALFMPLAILCKEIGILLPLYILVIEYTLLSNVPTARFWRNGMYLLMSIPLITIITYFLINLDGLLQSYQYRNFTLYQRLITEPSVLIDYINALIIPRPSAFTLFYDDYPIAAGLLKSPATLISLIAIFFMIIAGICFRNRLVVPSFAILWFFSGHILESSIIGLELYYEHRNYLPSYGIIILVSWLLINTSRILKKQYSFILSALYLLLITNVTVMETRLWAHPYLQAEEWSRVHPDSKRALTNLWNMAIVAEGYDRSRQLYNQFRSLDPNDIYPVIKEVGNRYCVYHNSFSGEEWEQARSLSKSVRFKHYGFIPEIDYLLFLIQKKNCDFGDLEQLDELLINLAQNSENMRSADLYAQAATISVLRQDLYTALKRIRISVSQNPKISNEIYMMRILSAAGYHNEAIEIIGKLKLKIAHSPKKRILYQDILKQYEDSLLKVIH